MYIKKLRYILAALAFFAVSCIVWHPLASAARKKGGSTSTVLGLNNLKGSMQGYSGITIDLNGDGYKDLVIGAPYAKHRRTLGALFVYYSTPDGFRARPSYVLPGEGNLGWSLVALGDVHHDEVNYFAAGAYSGSSENVSFSGTVTVYKGGKKPRQTAVFEGENAMDKFGYALATGDLNDDGYNDLIVGAPFNSPSPAMYQKGAVYVYFGPHFNPAQAHKISATEENNGIGFSLATGDINGDGIDDLLMGATGKVIGYYGAGDFATSSVVSPEVTFSNRDRNFGRSIAVLWDVDNDGYNDIALGADKAVVSGTIDSGRLFIVKGGEGSRSVNTGIVSEDLLASIDGDPNCGRFASAILPIEDLQGDGTPGLAVSAVHADGDPWLMTGKIFIFSGTTLISGASVSSAPSIPGTAKDMHLGAFLAIVDDKQWLVAGAPTEKNNKGKVRLYDLNFTVAGSEQAGKGWKKGGSR